MQRRSAAYLARAGEVIRAGKLGKVLFARAWIAGNRKSIGRLPDADGATTPCPGAIPPKANPTNNPANNLIAPV